MGKSPTNVETYLFYLFIFAVLVSGLVYLGNELIVNDNANLDNDSIEYIASLNGINISEYRQTQAALEASASLDPNYTQGTPKDHSIEFLYAKQKSSGIETTIKRIFRLPSYLIVDLLRLPANNFRWIIDLVGWILGFTVMIAIVYFIRGIVNK